MTDTTTNKPIRVETDAKDRPYIWLPLSQVEQVRHLLDTNGVRFWVSHTAVSVDGKPHMTYVFIRHGMDAGHVQAVLDSVA